MQTTKTSVHGAINMLGLAKRTRAKILQASTSEVYGDPDQHPQREEYWGNVNPIGPRSCYDDDLIDAMVAFMATGAEVTGPINVGNPDEFSIRELAEKVLAVSGSKSGVEHKDLPADDPRQRRPDIAKAREVLGWQPTVSLDEGLVPTMAYFKGLIGEQSAR